MISNPKFLLLGIGSIGGVVAYKLLQAKFDCTLITGNETIARAVKKNGLVLNNISEKKISLIKPEKVYSDFLELREQYDYIFFMMKAPKIDHVLNQAYPFLKTTGYAVSFQNGIIYEKFHSVFGNNVLLAVVLFNSIMNEPGIYTLSKSESIIIGSPYPVDLNGMTYLKHVLSTITDCELSSDIIGVCWSKLAINCSINAITAISGKPLGQVLKKKYGKETFFSIYREVIEMAENLGIKLAKLKIDPYLLYQTEETSFYKKCIQFILINQIGKNYATIYPSMLQDVKRGKITEIDFLNGYISKIGHEINVSTPVNDEMVSLVKKIEVNLLKPDPYLLKIAYEMPTIRNSSQKANISI